MVKLDLYFRTMKGGFVTIVDPFRFTGLKMGNLYRTLLRDKKTTVSKDLLRTD